MKLTESPELFVGVLGVGLLGVVQLYENTAPSLAELREHQPGTLVARQALMDADLIIGGTTLIVALASALTMRSLWPMFFFFGGFIFVSGWHHLVLNSPSITH